MNGFLRLLPVLTVSLFLHSGLLPGQDTTGITAIRRATDTLRLKGYSSFLSRKFQEEHRFAIEISGTKGWPVRGTTSGGGVFELQRVAHGRPLYYTTTNLNAAKTVSAEKVWDGGGLGLSLDGSGIAIREWDAGRVRETHQEFGSRVTSGDGTVTLADHSTHVAGTMIAAGVIGAAKGMSPGATLRSFDWNDDIGEMAAEAASGMLLSNSSYVYVTGWYYNGSWGWYGDPAISATEDYGFGFYGDFARQTDSICQLAPYYLPCKAAGNDRGEYNGSGPQEPDGGADGFDCIPDMGNAKNNLTVGCVDDIPDGYHSPSDVLMSTFSDWGPTDDGRIKPDIVANGIGLFSTLSSGNATYGTSSGTSMASPNACGSLNLLQQHYHSLYSSYMRASTLKALVIHTADEAGTANGPDYRFGWGILDVAQAATVISEKGTNTIIQEPLLVNGNSYTLTVTATGGQPLKATIAWTDPAGPVMTPALNSPAPSLVNDLDLRIDGTWQPWILDPSSPASGATTGDNSRDNTEQVIVYAPSAGLHIITVTHKGTLSGESQVFSLIVTGIFATVADPVPFTATGDGQNGIDLRWTKNASGNKVLLAWSSNGVFGTPVNGTAYTPGSSIPGGGTVLCNGEDTSYAHLSLGAGTRYYYRIWSYDNSVNYSFGRRTTAATPCTVINSFPVTENFDGSGLPSCWSVQPSGSGTYVDWSVSGTSNAGGTANEVKASFSGVNPGITRLKSVFFNTSGLSSLNLSFRYMLDDYATGATLRVQSSTDGVTWANEDWSFATVSNTNKGPFAISTTITHNLDSPNTCIAFVIEGNLYSYNYWYIDNLSITAPGYWIGGAPGNPNDWNTAANWGDISVPGPSTDVIVTPRIYQPVVNTDPASPAQCRNLTLAGGAVVTVATGKKLVMNGNMTIRP
jgi:hypothetical protein